MPACWPRRFWRSKIRPWPSGWSCCAPNRQRPSQRPRGTMPDGRLRAPLAPGSTIGILGSGQLGRMLAMAAARLGLKTHIYCEHSGPAFDVATHTSKAGFEDKAALSAFAKVVDAVTYEFENVPLRTAGHLAALVPVRPGAKALEVAQDRLAEKTFLTGLGIPVAPFRPAASDAEVRQALAQIGAAAILKTRRFGYDGKGQVGLAPGDDVAAAWAAINANPAVLEQRLAFVAELSALVVRAADGTLAFYDCPINVHKNGILHRSSVPAALPAEDLAHARQIGAAIADALDYVGVLARSEERRGGKECKVRWAQTKQATKEKRT